MAFIRVKWIGDHSYHYLVEGHREGGAVRQVVLAYLGRHATVAAALEAAEAKLRDHARQESEEVARRGLASPADLGGGWPWKRLRLEARVELLRHLAARPRPAGADPVVPK
jgi:hypothetical protein